MRQAWIRLVIFALVLGGGSGALGAAHNFAGWPPGWVEAYQRFQHYIEARDKYFPLSDLHVDPDGKIYHSVPVSEDSKGTLSLAVLFQGRTMLVTGQVETLLTRGMENMMKPGVYSVLLRSAGSSGFQYIYPTLWVEIYDQPGFGDGGRTAPAVRSVRMLPARVPEESFWPNERSFLFLDFHNFGQDLHDLIYKANTRVSPAIVLSFDKNGILQRTALEPGYEKLLSWRIYFKGRLIEKGSASGVLRYELKEGGGSYEAFVGVDGPDGFMPVSNLVEFPLFSNPDGSHTVIPARTNPNAAPDFIAVLPEGTKDPGNQELLNFWRSWSAEISGYKEGTERGVLMNYKP